VPTFACAYLARVSKLVHLNQREGVHPRHEHSVPVIVDRLHANYRRRNTHMKGKQHVYTHTSIIYAGFPQAPSTYLFLELRPDLES